MLTELFRSDIILNEVPVYFIYYYYYYYYFNFFRTFCILIIVIISMFFNFLPSIKCIARASFIQCLALLAGINSNELAVKLSDRCFC